jgi:hypothetical protein
VIEGRYSQQKTNDGGATWRDQESASRSNLYAVQAFGKGQAIAVGELGTVLLTDDAGARWETQPTITGKVLQAVVFRGGRDLWVAGRGGTILRRTEPLEPVKTAGSPKLPPVLRSAVPRNKPKPRNPLITITDDGDIPAAVQPRKDN